ncbi:TnsA endonuclease N-terminal domain-containing protein [Aquimarina gracilis]|uniref:TnsA endonuclease N-terminal domain-containing protein n=1 Tax=Aquimarina gracilis TaxID=874422 RepID=A0ABU5ZQJ4_9FLAO|nr:TnsA endonuclease N-terminal domain-containing protein [Aquimarina gracilis]MEB3344339.1 TnsA endonuclease N-terminal domain-containing protein [Aquimarina gracilis]
MRKTINKVSTKILEKAIWLSIPNTKIDPTDFQNPTRRIILNKSSEERHGTSGSYFSPKCNKRIFYESKLEFDFFTSLELSSDVIDFGFQPLKIEYKFNDYFYPYYPDFYYQLKNGSCVLGEVKKLNKMGLFLNWSKWKAMKHYCKKNGMGFLITDGKHEIRDLRNMKVNQNLRREILELFENSTAIDWEIIWDIKEKYKASIKNLTCLVYQEKIKWYKQPSMFVKDKQKM